jgi:hypothetical protein
MARDDTTGSAAMTELVEEHRWRVQNARRRYQQERGGQISEDTRRTLFDEALAYRDVLHEFREHGNLDPKWSERNVDWIDDVADQTLAVEQSANTRNGNAKTVEEPAKLHVDPRKVYQVTQALDEIAKDLGFRAEVERESAKPWEATV